MFGYAWMALLHMAGVCVCFTTHCVLCEPLWGC